jgi:hypothetical protein
MPQAYLCSDKMMGFSRLSRFGMTFKLLTADRGKALLTLYLGDFHARTFQPQERVQESTESNQGCGKKWQGSFAKYDPDTHSLRTHQCSLLEDSTESCQTLPAWGLMRDGECWEQPTLALRIKETEYGSLPKTMFPTPVRSEGNGSAAFKLTDAVEASIGKPCPLMQKNIHLWEKFQALGFPQKNLEKSLIGGKLNPTWVEWLMGWPLEWTDLKPLETDKFRQWQQQHGSY